MTYVLCSVFTTLFSKNTVMQGLPPHLARYFPKKPPLKLQPIVYNLLGKMVWERKCCFHAKIT